jgi:two-component system phosphate regulon sensor histidine kinase PhoR
MDRMMPKLTIRSKLLLFSIIFIASVVILTFLTNYTLEKVHKNVNLFVSEYGQVLNNLNSFKSSLLLHRLSLDEYLFTGSSVYLQNMQNIKNDCEKSLSVLKARNIESEFLEQLDDSFNSYIALTENLIFYYQHNPEDLETINAKKNRIDSLLENAIVSKIDLILEKEEERINKMSEELGQLHYSTLFFNLTFAVLLFLISIVYSFVMYKSIVEPLEEIEKGTKKIAEGEFGFSLKVKSEDEIGKLALEFNQMSQKLLEFKNKIEAHEKELEKTVEKRTKELREKVRELTEAKTALTNMMADLDETNKKLLEAQKKLKKSFRELKKLDVEKDRFISIAAHELKTPMTAISGFAQLLKNEKIIEDKERREKYLKIIEEEIKRLAKLVTDVLDLSRIDLGTIKVFIEEVNVKEILNEVKDEMEELAKEKGLYLNIKIDEKVSTIFTDREKLKRILVNLVSNGIKYTEKGGVTIEAVKEKDKVRFCVCDTGIGIPKEHFKKIFTRFYQVASPHTRKVTGSGLGLSICKELVELLGGRIWFESKLGKGSKFYFTLPIKYKTSKTQ